MQESFELKFLDRESLQCKSIWCHASFKASLATMRCLRDEKSLPSSEVSAAKHFGTAADVRKAAIVNDVILWGSTFPAAVVAARADQDFDALLVLAPGGGAYPQARLSEARWFHHLPAASWLLLAPPPFLLLRLTHPQGLTLPPLYCSLVTFFFKSLPSVEISWR